MPQPLDTSALRRIWWLPPVFAVAALLASLAVTALRPDRFRSEVAIAVRVEEPGAKKDQDAAEREALRVSTLLLSAARSQALVERSSATVSGPVATVELVTGSTESARQAATAVATQAISSATESALDDLEQTSARIGASLAEARKAADEADAALDAFYREQGVASVRDMVTAQLQALGAVYTAIDTARMAGGSGERERRVADQRIAELQRLSGLERQEAPLRRDRGQAQNVERNLQERQDAVDEAMLRLKTEPPYSALEPTPPERIEEDAGPLGLLATAIAGGAFGLLLLVVMDWLGTRRPPSVDGA